MAVVLTPKSRKATIKLANGTDSSGNVKTVNLNLGSLSVATWNADKAMAIINAITPCLTKTLHQSTTTEESIMTAGA